MIRSAVLFRSSPRKHGNTNALTDAAAALWREKGVRIQDFNLSDMTIKPCLACRQCQKDWTAASCIQKDDFEKVIPAVMDSDLLVLSTPIYSWYCTPPMKALLDRMVYAFNMYYGEERGPSLWAGKTVAVITTCGYPPEKGADLFQEGIRRYCRHSRLQYAGTLCEHHEGYQTVFMDDGKRERARLFAEKLLQ